MLVHAFVMSRVDYCNAVFAGSPKYITDNLQCVSSLAHISSTTACHTCCMRNCTGSTSQNVPTTNWESQCIAVCSTRLLSTWSTAAHQSQTFPANPTSFMVTHSTSPDRTMFRARHFRPSGLLCCMSNSLELATGQSL